MINILLCYNQLCKSYRLLKSYQHFHANMEGFRRASHILLLRTSEVIAIITVAYLLLAKIT